MLPRIIKIDHLNLRPHRLTDVDAVLSFASDPEWARYLPVPQPYTRSDAEKFIASQILLNEDRHQAWAITQNDKLIGGINIRLDFHHQVGEIGYSIARPYWGRGFITQVARAIIDAAFETYSDLNRIRAIADARNVASQRVMDKLGMTREGLLRQNRWVRDEFVDEVWYGLLRSEWTARREESTDGHR